MNKFFILSTLLVAVLVYSCQQSQFSTTTVQSRNGKVTYVNHYNSEILPFAKVNSHRRPFSSKKKEISLPPIATKESRERTNEGFIRIEPGAKREPVLLLASSSKNQLIPVIGNSFLNYVSPDTSDNKVVGKKKNMENPIPQIIRFRSGNEEKVWIVSRSQDTLKYKLVSEPNIIRTIMTAKIDTIIPDTSYHGKMLPEQEESVEQSDGKKGLLYSIMGFIPIVGIPFAILGIIFGLRVLHRIKLKPEMKKDKKMQRQAWSWVSSPLFLIFLSWFYSFQPLQRLVPLPFQVVHQDLSWIFNSGIFALPENGI
jgi:hypothetical protein